MPTLSREDYEEICDILRLHALSMYEAIQGYWDRNEPGDEGFIAIQESSERALELLGKPLPNYEKDHCCQYDEE